MRISHAIATGTLTLLTLISSPMLLFSQLPDGSDTGQSDETVNIYQQPKFIIPIVIFIIIAIAFYFWQKRSKK